MRILVFMADFDGGGAQRTMINLLNCFVSRGQSVLLAAARTDGPAKAWVSDALPILDLNRRRTREALVPLAQCVRRFQPDLIFASGVDANILAWLSSRFDRSKSTLVLRETNSHIARGDIGPVRRFLIGAAYRRTDFVVALSNGVREELIGSYGLEPHRVVTIHNPVKVRELGAASDKARLGPPPWPKTGPTIMAVGRMTRQKGFDRLIEACAALRDDIQIVILGEGEGRADLKKQAERLGLAAKLVMPGFVERPECWLAHADVFVLPSRWEGFGHVIVEAMAAGAPVVAFDCPHGPRDIICDGKNGLLVEEGDVGALTGAIQSLLDDYELAVRLRTQALADCTRYSDGDIANTYLELFARSTGIGSTRHRVTAARAANPS